MILVFTSATLEDLYSTCVCHCYIGGFVWYLCFCQCFIGGFVLHLCLSMLHWKISMTPVFDNVTLEDLYDTCVTMLQWRISMIHVFVNVTLEDLYDTCV